MQSTIRTITALLAGTALTGLSSPLLAQSAGPPQSEVDEVQDDQPDVASGDNAIVVTGTRIRGARIIGDTISLDRETIVEAGQIDLGEAPDVFMVRERCPCRADTPAAGDGG